MANQFVGEIRVFGGNFAIFGWAKCQGQLVAIDQQTVLYQLIGTTYGGDGVTTFALPNMRGNLAVSQGTGTGLQSWVIGESQGNANVTLTQAQVPQHTHQATFADNVQFTYEVATPGNTVYPGRLQAGSSYSAQLPTAQLAGQAISTQGGSQPHANTMPYLVMNYLIAFEGIFPTRN